MKRLFLIIVFVGQMLLQSALAAEILVIVNLQNAVDELSHQELMDLYMGRYTNFPNKVAALLLDMPMDSEIRDEFYRELVGKSVAEVNAYWARLMFTGRASPPRGIEDAEQVIKFIGDNKNAIGYVYDTEYDDSLKVVYRFGSN